MSRFQPLRFFEPRRAGYKLLPLRFTQLRNDRYVVTNAAGEYLVGQRSEIERLVKHQLEPSDPFYIEARTRQMLEDDTTSIASTLLAMKLRTRYASLSEFTRLHLFVVTLRCEHSCPYCQVSRQSKDRTRYDMTQEVADRSLDLVFESPARAIKIEFQGGEPLLAFDRIRQIVLNAKARNATANKEIGFVIATNLAMLTDEMLEFMGEHSIQVSTSLDGPADLHDRNRPRPGGNSHRLALEGIARVRAALGPRSVSALMTTTLHSLPRVREIIDEYVSLGFDGIFLRPLSPYGFALKTKSYQAYNAARWMEFYKEGLEYIVALNRAGVAFDEFYSSIVLRKMLTSDDPGYVDLMSPSGAGIAAAVYNYDGVVYASDEARMLAEMGDTTFKLGNVLTDSARDIFMSDRLVDVLEESFAFSSPMCNDCAFEPWCGSDPVFHHATQKDPVGFKPDSEFCSRNMEIFRYLIERMESDSFVRTLFQRWANP